MSTVEQSLGTPPLNSHWRCPKCWAAQEKGIRPDAEATSDMVACTACGAAFPEADVNGGKYDAEPPAVEGAGGRKRNPLALVVVAVVAAAMLYFGFHMARRSGTTTPGITKSGPAPDFTLEALDGKSIRLSDLRGKAVLLNFWATWCGPCKIETPWLVEFQGQYGTQGLQVVGVEMGDDGKEDIEKFIKEEGVNYPVLFGKEAVGDAYGGVPALPETFFIGRDGKIVDRIIGLKGKAEIEDSIKKALDTQAVNSQASLATLPPQK